MQGRGDGARKDITLDPAMAETAKQVITQITQKYFTLGSAVLRGESAMAGNAVDNALVPRADHRRPHRPRSPIAEHLATSPGGDPCPRSLGWRTIETLRSRSARGVVGVRTAAGSYTPVGPAPYVVHRNTVGAVVGSLFVVALFGFLMVWLLVKDGVSIGAVIVVAYGVVITAGIVAILLYLEIIRAGDRAGVRLAIDRAGIYLGERPVERIAWARVAEVVLSEVPSGYVEGVEFWTSRIEIRLTDRVGGGAERGSVRFVDHVDHDAVGAAVERHAPSVCATARGQIRN